VQLEPTRQRRDVFDDVIVEERNTALD